MAFCEDCGNKLSETTKFCGECGAKAENKIDVPKPEQKKRTKKVKISKPKADVGPTSVSTTDNEYLKEFFTKPKIKPKKRVQEVNNPRDPRGLMPPLWLLSLACFLLAWSEVDYWTNCKPENHCYEVDEILNGKMGFFYLHVIIVGFIFILLSIGLYMWAKSVGYSDNEGQWRYYSDMEKTSPSREAVSTPTAAERLKTWEIMSPLPLFKRLEEAQEMVAKSSYENLGIDEGDTTRPPAYCYGPHLEIFGDIFGERTDQTGIGKGADYYKFCEKKGLEGLYTREYDMMVVQFTENQIMVYKCIFDILEMTKRLEESYEWNYKHVVGINITGDEKEKDLGGGIAVTGTKYLVISAASGDKIRIVLGAGTRQMVGGKQKITALGGEEKIYKVANAAMKNIREAVREGAS